MGNETRTGSVEAVVDAVQVHQPDHVMTRGASGQQLCGVDALGIRRDRRTNDDPCGKQ
jgi:hypothetical protein